MEEKILEMTPELRDKLKGFLAFSVETPFAYVPKIFRENLPKENWPVFMLRSKNGLEIAKLEDNSGFLTVDEANKSTSFHPQSGTSRLNTLATGIIKFKNYPMEDGALISYDSKLKTLVVGGKSRTAQINDAIKHLPVDIQRDLQNAINERDTLAEEELRGLEY